MKDSQLFGQDQYGNIKQIRTDEHGFFVPSHNFRDVVSTGSATLTRATETTVLSGVAGKYLDVVWVNASNTSTVAQKIALRSSTGGGIEENFVIGANNDININLFVPHPQSEIGGTWTAQNTTGGEISDSPVTVDMHAVKHNGS
jgi:hypothetical protein